MDMTVPGINMNSDTIYTSQEDATKTKHNDELDNKKIEGLKQKIFDIVEEAIYNITAPTHGDEVHDFQGSDSGSSTAVDSLERKLSIKENKSTFKVNESQSGEEDLNASEENDIKVLYMVFGISAGLVFITLVVGVMAFFRWKKRGSRKI